MRHYFPQKSLTLPKIKPGVIKRGIYLWKTDIISALCRRFWSSWASSNHFRKLVNKPTGVLKKEADTSGSGKYKHKKYKVFYENRWITNNGSFYKEKSWTGVFSRNWSSFSTNIVIEDYSQQIVQSEAVSKILVFQSHNDLALWKPDNYLISCDRTVKWQIYELWRLIYLNHQSCFWRPPVNHYPNSTEIYTPLQENIVITNQNLWKIRNPWTFLPFWRPPDYPLVWTPRQDSSVGRGSTHHHPPENWTLFFICGPFNISNS